MKITRQIGKCGELLVQYRLLRQGIESAPMTTDAGIDLVAYAPGTARATTIQVKTTWVAKPAGGKGKLVLDWWVRDNSPAEIVAFVDLQSERIWLLRHDEVRLNRLHQNLQSRQTCTSDFILTLNILQEIKVIIQINLSLI